MNNQEIIKFMKEYLPGIEKIIYNYPATILFMKDGSKSVVKHVDSSCPDLEKSILYAWAKYEIKKKKKKNSFIPGEWNGVLIKEIYRTLNTDYPYVRCDERILSTDEQKEIMINKKHPLAKNLTTAYIFDYQI